MHLTAHLATDIYLSKNYYIIIKIKLFKLLENNTHDTELLRLTLL